MNNHIEIYPYVVEYLCTEEDSVEIISAVELPTGYRMPASKMPGALQRDLQDKIEVRRNMGYEDRCL